jgi:hypothetical protein
MDYKSIVVLKVEATCKSISMSLWDRLMEGAVRADHRAIDKLVRKLLPELYEALALNCYNLHHYFRTKRHLILVHSDIEYFILYSYADDL